MSREGIEFIKHGVELNVEMGTWQCLQLLVLLDKMVKKFINFRLQGKVIKATRIVQQLCNEHGKGKV